jgi:hypothetical protein
MGYIYVHMLGTKDAVFYVCNYISTLCAPVFVLEGRVGGVCNVIQVAYTHLVITRLSFTCFN